MIVYWNRALKREETEQVYGDGAVKFLYQNPFGQKLADWALSSRPFSQAYGAYQASPKSRSKIAPFIETFKIPMEDYEDPGFQSFNDFFIRKFKPGKRPFNTDPKRMPAPAEARYFAYERVTDDQLIPVKGRYMTSELLLGEQGSGYAQEFEGGPLLLARLCPVDYHRYHYPDDGKTVEHYTVSGKLHSVNPLALKYRGDIFAINERRVAILDTPHFGKLAYIEVGAMCVGKIVQSHDESRDFKRGDEKGYFLFGASTVIVLGQPGKWRPDADLIEQTRQGRETYVRIGDAVAGAT